MYIKLYEHNDDVMIIYPYQAVKFLFLPIFLDIPIFLLFSREIPIFSYFF